MTRYRWQELLDEYQTMEWTLEDEDAVIDDDDREWFDKLKALDKEVNECLSFGPRALVEWIHEDDFLDHVKSECEAFGYKYDAIFEGHIDWKEVAEEEFAPNYEDISFEGENYYFRDNT